MPLKGENIISYISIVLGTICLFKMHTISTNTPSFMTMYVGAALSILVGLYMLVSDCLYSSMLKGLKIQILNTNGVYSDIFCEKLMDKLIECGAKKSINGFVIDISLSQTIGSCSMHMIEQITLYIASECLRSPITIIYNFPELTMYGNRPENIVDCMFYFKPIIRIIRDHIKPEAFKNG